MKELQENTIDKIRTLLSICETISILLCLDVIAKWKVVDKVNEDPDPWQYSLNKHVENKSFAASSNEHGALDME